MSAEAASQGSQPQLDAELARFVAVTNCPPEQAQFFMEAAGSFEGAVSVFFGAPLTHHLQIIKLRLSSLTRVDCPSWNLVAGCFASSLCALQVCNT